MVEAPSTFGQIGYEMSTHFIKYNPGVIGVFVLTVLLVYGILCYLTRKG